MSHHRYGIAALVYTVFVMLGSLATRCHPEGHYIAAATLVHNHRITSGDLRRPFQWPFAAGWYLPDRSAMEGKYLVSAPICACKEVAPSTVQVSPDLQAGTNLNLVVLPLPTGSQLPRLLDAGSVVEILSSQKPEAEHAAPGSKKKPAKTAAVHAILCDAPTGQEKNPPTCYAVLAVPAKIEEYISKKRDTIRLVPKTIAARNACKEGVNDASTNVAKDHRTKENP